MKIYYKPKDYAEQVEVREIVLSALTWFGFVAVIISLVAFF